MQRIYNLRFRIYEKNSTGFICIDDPENCIYSPNVIYFAIEKGHPEEVGYPQEWKRKIIDTEVEKYRISK